MPKFKSSSETNESYLSIPRKHFVVVEAAYSLDDPDDALTLERIWSDALVLATKVNKATASDALVRQTRNRKFRNCFAGGLAEDAWIRHLNEKAGARVAAPKLFDGTKETPDKQIDIVVGESLTCEVRSSFVTNGVNFGLFSASGFDILGPYTNSAKPHENWKDYYLRVLYPGLPSSLSGTTNDTASSKYAGPRTVRAYLVGGATRAELAASTVFKNLKELSGSVVWDSEREMLPDDTKYRVLPLREADDTDLITSRLLAAYRRACP